MRYILWFLAATLLLSGCPSGAGFDLDGDGWPDANDCDPTDPALNPGADEVCGDGLDNDCDDEIDEQNAVGCSDWFRDDDGDGSGSSASACLCEAIAPYTAPTNDDCNDNNPAQNGLDGDGDGNSPCDGDCDDSDPTLNANDADGDGYSSCNGDCNDSNPALQLADVDGDGGTTCDGDCDDSDPALNVSDEDHDGSTTCDGDCDDFDDDLSVADEDGDGFTSCGEDCNDSLATVAPGAADLCDGILDNNCDGIPDPRETDDDLDGWTECGGDCDDPDPEMTLVDGDGDGWVACLDCDDENPFRFPGNSEACDQLDNDCDGVVPTDEYDGDGDGYLACADCDDSDGTVYPDAPELCNGGLDDDCDPTTSESFDTDGDGLTVCMGDCDDNDPAMHLDDNDGDGFAPCHGDCDDSSILISPAAFELCGDLLDNNCDGAIDVACINCAIWVPTDQPTVQAAIDAVPAGDAVCVEPGVHPGLVVFGGKATHVLGVAGADLTTLDGQGAGSVVTLDAWEGTDSVMQGFTITGGDGAGGGGIRVLNSSPLLLNLTITGNNAGEGGGLWADSSGEIVLSDVTIQDNTSRGDGGGFLFVESTPAALNVTVADNVALGSGGGGLIDSWALFSGPQPPELSNIRLTGNMAGGPGGGLAIYDSDVVATNLIVAGNDATTGGGLFIQGGVPEITNCTVTFNDASLDGGGVALVETDPLLINTIISSNTSVGPGGGILGDGDSDPSLGWCDVWDNSPGDVEGIPDPTGGAGNLSADPGFIDLSSTDPLDWDVHLDPVSVFVDAGSPSIQDPDGSASDMGAFGGPGASGWDLDDDGWSSWWQPGAYDNRTYPWLGWDCDDLDPMSFPGVGACIADPTFVAPLCGLIPSLGPCREAGSGIAVPQHHSLVRGEVPISADLPIGAAFHLEVHDPDGVLRQSCDGVVQRELGDDLLAELAVATRTPQGNVCNWDTGLTAYAYGDQYGPHSHGVAGWHEISLVADLPGGGEARDTIRVFVGSVVSFVYGNEVRSVDGRVQLDLPEHAIDGSFRLFGIDPIDSSAPIASWRILSTGPTFGRSATLRIAHPELRGRPVSLRDPSGATSQPVCGAWSTDGVFEGRLQALPGHETLLVVGGDAAIEDCPAEPEPTAIEATEPVVLDFERPDHGVVPRGDLGARVLADNRGEQRCLKLRNPEGGYLGASILRGPIDLRERSQLSMDVRLSEGAEVDLYARIGGQWHEYALTGGLGNYPRVGIVPSGSSPVPADGAWHTVTVDLAADLAGHEPVLDELMVAGFEVGGYMGLHRASLPEGASVWIDTLRIDAAAPADEPLATPWSEERSVKPADIQLVYEFAGPGAALELGRTGDVLDAVFEPLEPHTFGGFYLPQEGADRDWSGWDALVVDFSSSRGDPGLTVALKDAAEHQVALDLSQLVQAGWIGRQATVEIPLVAFPGVDLSEVTQVVFALDSGDEPEVRTVQISEVTLARGSTADLVVGRFSSGATTWGAPPRLFHTREAGVSALTTAVGQLISVWGVRSQQDQESWAGWSIDLPDVDVSGYEELQLRLKRTTGGEAPNLYLRGGQGETIVSTAPFLQATDAWQVARIPIDALHGGTADLSALRELTLAFEWADANGALVLDELRFSSPAAGGSDGLDDGQAVVDDAASAQGSGCGLAGGSSTLGALALRGAPIGALVALMVLIGFSRREGGRS